MCAAQVRGRWGRVRRRKLTDLRVVGRNPRVLAGGSVMLSPLPPPTALPAPAGRRDGVHPEWDGAGGKWRKAGGWQSPPDLQPPAERAALRASPCGTEGAVPLPAPPLATRRLRQHFAEESCSVKTWDFSLSLPFWLWESGFLIIT